MKIHLSDYAVGAIERRLFECQAKLSELSVLIRLDNELTAEEKERKENDYVALVQVSEQLQNDIEVCKHIQKMNKVDIVKLLNE